MSDDISTNQPMFKKIDHINIVVSDLKAAEEFFLNLGFTVVEREMLEGEWLDRLVNLTHAKVEYLSLAIPHTQTKLELLKYCKPEGNVDTHISMANQIGFRHIALEVKDIENVVLNLKKKGITSFSDLQIYDNREKLCYFLGVEGIILELVEFI